MESLDQEHQLGCYFECVNTTPKTMPLNGGQCLHQNVGNRDIDEHPRQSAPLGSFKANQPPCISSSSYNSVHDVSKMSQMKMSRPGQ
jgi:hypothetical protein